MTREEKGVLMKRFMRLSLILFGAGLALVLYAVLFGPAKFERSINDKQIPVGEIQYDAPEGSPQKPWLESDKSIPSPNQAQPAGR